jgi:hypothetical protein
MRCADVVHKHEIFEIDMPAARIRMVVALRGEHRYGTVCMLDQIFFAM